MARVVNQSIKENMVNLTLDYLSKIGKFDLSLEEIGSGIKISPRMIIYHFKTKSQLEAALISGLEGRFRQEFKKFQKTNPNSSNLILAFWIFMTGTKKRRNLLKLSNEITFFVSQRKKLQKTAHKEIDEWTKLLIDTFEDEKIANLILITFQGAIVDLFMTNNTANGESSIETLQALIISKKKKGYF